MSDMFHTCGDCKGDVHEAGAPYCDDCSDLRIDAYHSGCKLHQAGMKRPDNDPIKAEGWDDRERDMRVCVVMPSRPEGYYHAPIGTYA